VTVTRAGRGVDPDEIARLEDERDHLLRSLDDLDAEHEAGDLTDEEYEGLRDEYTNRAAEVLKAIDGHRDAMVAAKPPRSTSRILASVLGVVAVATVAGVLLAHSLGARGNGTEITGSGGTMRDRIAACQRLFGTPSKAVGCYDKILADDPKNVEALTYRGWALAQGGRSTDAGDAFDKVVALDPTYPDVYVFRAVLKKNAGDFAAAQHELDTLYSLNPPASLIDTMQSMGLDQEIALELLDPRVASCWTKVADFGTKANESSTTVAANQAPAGFGPVLACFDGISDTDPAHLQALTFRAAAIYGVGDVPDVPSALAGLGTVLAANPKDPTALTVRAALEIRSGQLEQTIADVTALKGLGRPNALVSGIQSALRRDVTAVLGEATTTTTTNPTGG
jgi:tetratricopeptide (TPR) repeat protein